MFLHDKNYINENCWIELILILKVKKNALRILLLNSAIYRMSSS